MQMGSTGSSQGSRIRLYRSMCQNCLPSTACLFWPSYIYIYVLQFIIHLCHILFVYSSVRHVSYFHLLSVNNAMVNTGVQIPV